MRNPQCVKANRETHEFTIPVFPGNQGSPSGIGGFHDFHDSAKAWTRASRFSNEHKIRMEVNERQVRIKVK